MLQLNDLAQTDPVKATLTFQQEDQGYLDSELNFLVQAHNFSNKEISLQQSKPSLLISFLNNTFGIPMANAQVETHDPGVAWLTSANAALNKAADEQMIQWGATNAAIDQTGNTSLLALISSIHIQNMGQKLEALLKNTLLQILKNTLVSIIQREVLTWIQGSGAPRFITNWGTQLVNAAQTSAINAINAQMSCGVYPAFIPQIKVTLNAYYKPGGNACANQFAAALGSNSLQQFYNNFANGGFVAFGASTLPSGNPYGQLFFNAQSVSLSYSNQQGASGLQAQSSQGLASSLTCA